MLLDLVRGVSSRWGVNSKAELEGQINVISWHVVKYVSFYGLLDSIKGKYVPLKRIYPGGYKIRGVYMASIETQLVEIFWNDRSK